MKVGISLRIDVSKINKEVDLYKGEKGTYLNMTTFIDLNEKDQFGNNGFIAVETSKEAREQGIKGTILGNSKVFYTDEQQAQQVQQAQQGYAQPSPHANNPQGYAQQQQANYAQQQAPEEDFPF